MEEQTKGLVLALSSSGFIGASFIIKKKGLRAAGARGGALRAGQGGHTYLHEPLWWMGMLTMVGGEVANFAAYAFAPAILVTPLGAVSILVSAVLAHFLLGEKLHGLGVLGCVLCVVGAVTIIIHAPVERTPSSVLEVWAMATDIPFLLYATTAVMLVVFLQVACTAPQYGPRHLMVYIGICSLMGSLSVMSCKALGIALKLTFAGDNQLVYFQSYVFAVIVAICVVVQMNYLNKEWNTQTATQIVSELCGFVIIVAGFVLLHSTKDYGDQQLPSTPGLPGPGPLSAQQEGNSAVGSPTHVSRTRSIELQKPKSAADNFDEHTALLPKRPT
eukprot:jgi/Chlat1/6209/Chrsp44S05803